MPGDSHRLFGATRIAIAATLVSFALPAIAQTVPSTQFTVVTVPGAPKIGDHTAWAPRIAQGKDTLYTHAISGKGLMPPKGGITWPDATIRMTVDYMVSQAK